MTDEALPITQTSGHRIMWMLTMFDLPVVKKADRKAATQFRQDLLKLGFEMAQYSVYMRCCVTRERCDAIVKRIRKAMPSGGKVAILVFTDKQYENMLHFYAREEIQQPDKGQLMLF